jgi:hypothetical protein
MSEVDQIDNVMTLEDLFLSDQFGKPAAAAPSVLIDDALFRDAPLRAPLVPLAAYPMTTGTQASTTHLRRNRSFAAVSGVAAAMLIAVGFISSPAKTRNTGEQAIGGGTTTVPKTPPVHTHVVQPTGSTVNVPNPSASSGIDLASVRVGVGNAHGAAAVLATATHTATPTPSSPSVVTKPTTTPTPTAPSGSVLSPVVHLVGQVVSTTGNTVTGVSNTLTAALPVAAPVTNLVGGLGGTLSGLGNRLVASA